MVKNLAVSQLRELAQKNYRHDDVQNHLLGRILDDVASTSTNNKIDTLELLNFVADHLTRLQGM